MGKNILITIMFLILFACKKNDASLHDDEFIPYNMEHSMRVLGLTYGVFYDYVDNSESVIGQIKINSDTSVVERFNGNEYMYSYQYSSNNATYIVGKDSVLVVTFKLKNNNDVPLDISAPVTKCAKNQFFQISNEGKVISVSGTQSMGGVLVKYKIKTI